MEFIQIKFDINATKVLGKVKGLMDRLSNTKPAFKSIANFIRSRVLLHFRNQTGRTAGWKKLSPKTSYLSGHKLLVNNGNLINSLQGGADSIFIYQDGMAVVGTNVPYAKYHEHPKYPNAPTNSFHEKKRIPKRDFMFIQAPDIAQIKDILNRFVMSGKS